MTRTPRFRSTRSEEIVSFREALLQGLAENGGLYIPTHIPPAKAHWESADSFVDMADLLLRPWMDSDVPSDALSSMIRDALNFPVVLKSLPDSALLGRNVYILELFHGPTLSFKDFGARMMGRWMDHFLSGQNEKLTILVATSGDTGSAVADGFAGSENIRVILLYPKGGVSPTQEMQLSADRSGVFAYAVHGSFDDCQHMVKQAFQDPGLSHIPLSSANSINIGRLLPQSLYYYWTANRLGGNSSVITVPSGNLGNLTAGLLASRGGMPVHSFVAAHNANGFFPEFLRSGKEMGSSTVKTLSNAMDVGVPSNFERIKALFAPDELRSLVTGYSVADDSTLETMKLVFEQTGYVACPHTAVGLTAASRYRSENGEESPMVVLSTAHPAKFPEIVERAIGRLPETPEELETLKTQPHTAADLEADPVALRNVILSRVGG